jgi:hypothetical protein
MKTSRREAHHVSHNVASKIAPIFGYIRYVFSALSVVAFGLSVN